MTLKKLKIEDIRSLEPCYDPGLYLSEDWSGTALDILKMENVPVEDRFWVVLGDEFIDPKTLRLFAVDCARRALARIENPDPRSITACDVAERYAHGQATQEEIDEARADAWNAARDATRDAARNAGWDVVYALDAALDAALAAAWNAARNAARNAALGAAWGAALAAAGDAERKKQISTLIKLLEKNQNEETGRN